MSDYHTAKFNSLWADAEGVLRQVAQDTWRQMFAAGQPIGMIWVLGEAVLQRSNPSEARQWS